MSQADSNEQGPLGWTRGPMLFHVNLSIIASAIYRPGSQTSSTPVADHNNEQAKQSMVFNTLPST